MPLSSTVLQGLIRANLLADSDSHAVDNAALTALCKAVAEAVVTHITTAALVLPVALVAPPGGGPVTGTGTIT